MKMIDLNEFENEVYVIFLRDLELMKLIWR